jgi:alpha-ribazole phosphatase
VAELILIRHGATDAPGRLHGRSDPGLARLPEPSGFAVAAVRASPARRARETASRLWPGVDVREDARLWEQDFGAWDGRPFADLPDLGALARNAMAAHAPEGGESFRAMAERVRPALIEAADEARMLGGVVAVVAHAGTVRAGLALAMGDVPGALAFEVAHLSATRLRCLPGGAFAVVSVNGMLG